MNNKQFDPRWITVGAHAGGDFNEFCKELGRKICADLSEDVNLRQFYRFVHDVYATPAWHHRANEIPWSLMYAEAKRGSGIPFKTDSRVVKHVPAKATAELFRTLNAAVSALGVGYDIKQVGNLCNLLQAIWAYSLYAYVETKPKIK